MKLRRLKSYDTQTKNNKYPNRLLALQRIFDLQMLLIKWLDSSILMDAHRACFMYRQPWKLLCVPTFSLLIWEPLTVIIC